ncbi:MAG: hypothetical protein H0X38_09480 [Planctomycetes bacterium]|nr:hypothetical protein [Planctomycetota bacterium]
MRLFLKRFALFMLLVGAGAALLQALTLHALRRDAKALQDAAWAQEAAAVTTLVIGDSHAHESIDGRLLPGSFIYSSSGENLLFVAAKLRWALREQAAPALRHVVLALGLDAFSASHALPMGDEWYYARHADAAAVLQGSGDGSAVARFWLRGLVVPWAGRGESVFPLLDQARRKPSFSWHDQMEQFWDAGFPPFSAQVDRTHAARQRALEHLAGMAPFDPAPVAALARIRQLCVERGLTLTVLDAPVTDLYYRELAARSDPARYAQILDEELVAHGIVPLDLHALFADRYDLFRDPDHLLAAGRREVTARIAAALERAQVPR